MRGVGPVPPARLGAAVAGQDAAGTGRLRAAMGGASLTRPTVRDRGPRPGLSRRGRVPLARATPWAGSLASRRIVARGVRRRIVPSATVTDTRRGTPRGCRNRVTRTHGTTPTPRSYRVGAAPSTGPTCQAAASATHGPKATRAFLSTAKGAGGAIRARGSTRRGPVVFRTPTPQGCAPVRGPATAPSGGVGTPPVVTGSCSTAVAAAPLPARPPTRAGRTDPTSY